MDPYVTSIPTFRGGNPNTGVQSSPGSFMVAPPTHSTFADRIADEIGTALGKGAFKGSSDEEKALAEANRQKTAEAKAKAAADQTISQMVADHINNRAALQGVDGIPQTGLDLQSLKDKITPVAVKGGYKPGDLTDTLMTLVSNVGHPGDADYDSQVTAAGVAKNGPLGKDNAYSLPRQNTIRKEDTDATAADRVAQEEGADRRNKATNDTSRANNADTISAEAARNTANLAAQGDRERIENERKTREGYKDPKVLGDLIDQSLGATPQGKAPADGDTSIDPMVRADILARASQLVEAGNTREAAVLQAIKEKGAVTPAKKGFLGFGSHSAQFSPVAAAAADLTAGGPAPPAPTGQPPVRNWNPKTGKLE